MQAGHVSAQEGEARARQFGAGLEIHAQRRAKVGVFLRLEREGALLSPGRHFHVVRLVLARRNVFCGQVGNARQQVGQFAAQRSLLLFQFGHGSLDFGHFGFQRLCLLLVSLAHGLADGLGRFVAAALGLLQTCGERPAALVDLHDTGGNRLQRTAGQGGIEGIGIFPDQSQVVHGAGLCLARSPVVQL